MSASGCSGTSPANSVDVSLSLVLGERGHPKSTWASARTSSRWRHDIHSVFHQPLGIRPVYLARGIEDRARMAIRRRRDAQHQPHPATIKKRHARHGEEQRQPQYVAVECRCVIHVLYDNRNLPSVLIPGVVAAALISLYPREKDELGIANYLPWPLSSAKKLSPRPSTALSSSAASPVPQAEPSSARKTSPAPPALPRLLRQSPPAESHNRRRRSTSLRRHPSAPPPSCS